MELNLSLHPKQIEAFTSEATEILYGGAAGGGKSYLMRVMAIALCAAIPGLNVYLFRRKRQDLIKNHVEGPKGFRALLAEAVNNKHVEIVEGEVRFSNGSKIFLCHCHLENDRFNYQGAEIHVLFIDEITHFTEVIYRFLRGRVRAPGIKPPKELEQHIPKIMVSGNPGGIGHAWVKETWIDPRAEMQIEEVSKKEGGMLRQYIPARLEDNPSMAEDDPTYEYRLEGLGNEELVKGLRYGIWNVVAGAYFTMFGERHYLTPFDIPQHWTRFRAMDWGFAEPFSIGWWAVSDGTQTPEMERLGYFIPSGALVRYREWYGRTGPNQGIRLEPSQVAKGIKEREAGEKISYGVADPQIFQHHWGPSIAEMFADEGIYWIRGDNKSRVNGWRQMTQRMLGKEVANGDYAPMIYCFESCRDSIRTIPVLMHDEKKIEDVGLGEDHAAEEWRLACMSRPWETRVREKPKGKNLHEVTLNELWEIHEEERGASDRV